MKSAPLTLALSLAANLYASISYTMAQQASDQRSADITGSVGYQATHKSRIFIYQTPSFQTDASSVPAARYDYYWSTDKCLVRLPSGESLAVPDGYCS